jgi:hypothetical protein
MYSTAHRQSVDGRILNLIDVHRIADSALLHGHPTDVYQTGIPSKLFYAIIWFFWYIKSSLLSRHRHLCFSPENHGFGGFLWFPSIWRIFSPRRSSANLISSSSFLVLLIDDFNFEFVAQELLFNPATVPFLPVTPCCHPHLTPGRERGRLHCKKG